MTSSRINAKRLFASTSKSVRLICLAAILALPLIFPKAWTHTSLPLGGVMRGAASAQIPANQSAQSGMTAEPATARKSQAVASAVPSVTLTDHRVTAEGQPPGCVAPTAKTIFKPTDARVHQWNLVDGAVAGDVIRWDFRQPNGTTYFQTEGLTLTFSGSVCFSAFINLAGTGAASLLGNWEVRVTYNGVLLTTDTFAIRNDTVVVEDHRISGSAPTNDCTPPSVKNSFLPTDVRAYQWTLISAGKTGDTVRWEFVQPNGSIYASSNTLTVPADGGRCFWVSMDIAGQPAASIFGSWQVRVIYNDVPLLQTPDTFTISASDLCPTVGQLSPTSGFVGSSVTISGTNFTGVNSVKFAPDVTAAFTVVNATTITATVPFGAATGSIKIGKPGCNQGSSASYTVKKRPLIQVTPLTLGFGSVAVGSSASLPVTVTNNGNAPLIVTSVSSNNPQFSTSLQAPSFGVAAGASSTFSVEFAPTSGGAKSATLSVSSDDTTQPLIQITATGNGLIPVIDATPTTFGFGDVNLASTRDLPLTIRNTGTAALNIRSLDISNAVFAVVQILEKPGNAQLSLPLVIPPGGSVEVTLRMRPPYLPTGVGTLNGELTIQSNDPVKPGIVIPLTGRGIGALIGTPASLSLGSVSVCSPSVSAILPVTNMGTAPMTIVALNVENPRFTLARPNLPLVVQPNTTVNLTVSFATRTTGPQSGRLLILSNAVNFPTRVVNLTASGAPIPQPSMGSISVSRLTLAHGRADNVRPSSPFNPNGLSDVPGFVFPGAPLPLNSIAPGLIVPPLIGSFPGIVPSAIGSAPDPFRITLAGGVTNPIVASAANIPSGFTLAVAEGIAAPDLTRWERVGIRFGAGNLYATVNIPGTSIVAGRELVSEADLDAYTANSIIYEAPDFGLLVIPTGQNGGTATVSARARRLPPDPLCPPVNGTSQFRQIEYSRTVHLEILTDRTVLTRRGIDLEIEVFARISGNFDPPGNTVIRWAFDGRTVDRIQDRDDDSIGTDPRVVSERFRVPVAEECQLAQITVVASSLGNDLVINAVNPFLQLAPTTIGLFTFRSGGTTVEDTKAVLLRLPDSNCGGGASVGWLRGTVTNLLTGVPISGARVTIVGTELVAVTGFDGSYVFSGVPAGPRTLETTALRFEPNTSQVVVTANQTNLADIALKPLSGKIAGHVFNRVGNTPIAGVSVSVKGTTITATTAGDGSYTLESVPTGSQTITATAGNFLAEQRIVNAIANLTRNVDFFLVPTTGTITGFVRNSTNSAGISGASVSAGGISGTTSAGGGYTLNNVPEGAQTVSATAVGFNPGSTSTTVVTGATANADVSLTPLVGSITGMARDDESGNPVQGVSISVAGSAIATTTGPDGLYTLNNVPEGTVTLNVTATDYVGFQETGVVVVGNETTARDLQLTKRKGTIRGRVTNFKGGQGIGNAQIELLPFPLTFTSSVSDGNYTLNSVPTGTQVIRVSATGFYSKIGVVAVQADTTVTQDFVLNPRVGAIRGRVFKSRQSLAGATINVAGTNISTVSGIDGAYGLDDVPEGAQELIVTVGPTNAARVSVVVQAGEGVNKNIFLEVPVGTLTGMVTDGSTGLPFPNAGIIVFPPTPIGLLQTTYTDSSGNYILTDIPEGTILAVATARGYDVSEKNILIQANKTSVLNFTLQRDADVTGTIVGIVKNSANNQPLAGVRVAVDAVGESTLTGADGAYELTDIPNGSAIVTASKTGFRTQTVTVDVPPFTQTVQNFTLVPGGGTITGSVRDASTGNAIVGATLTVGGTNLATTSGAGGAYTLADVPPGLQTLNVSATGYSSTQLQVTVTDGGTVSRDVLLSPTLPAGQIRIALGWNQSGGAPHDLDAHLTGPNGDGSCFHVYYSNKGKLDSAPFAQLELDNISTPAATPQETIRISKLSPGTYRFYVYNYSAEDPDGLARSRPTVQIFGASGLIGTYTISAGIGRTWSVFTINGQTGAVTGINALVDPPSSCQ